MNEILKRNKVWQFWVDRGGTFTDILAKKPNGEIESLKLLSENSKSYSDPIEKGIEIFFEKNKELNPKLEDIKVIKIGTTIGTNALLEKKGSKTALITTEGFGDTLKIGFQNRPNLFDINIKLPDQLYEDVVEIEERILSDGSISKNLDIAKTRNQLIKLYKKGIKSLAIIFMHGYKYPDHEIIVSEIASKIGFKQISCSHIISPTIKFINRGDTSVLDAYLSPIIYNYTHALKSKFPNTKLMFMQSNGGLADAKHFMGKNSILSGPAGGVIGAIITSTDANIKNIIGFDMGGTSTDVCHYNGKIERTFNSEISGIKIQTPMIALHTVAAGGGSILHFDGSRFRVGPDSAGANPGPACYDKGGPLTVTDANFILGKLQKEFFPSAFGVNSNSSVNISIVKTKFRNLSLQIEKNLGKKMSLEEIASGFIKIAVENMSNAIKKISIEKGYNVKNYTLCCFGGAGGQHACLVAEALGINKVFIHPLSGVLSALGIGNSNLTIVKEKTIELLLDEINLNHINSNINELIINGTKEIYKQDPTEPKIISNVSLNIKYDGTDSTLNIPYKNIKTSKKDFTKEHTKLFGFFSPEKQMIIQSIVVELGVNDKESIENINLNKKKKKKSSYQNKIKVYMKNKWYETIKINRDDMELKKIYKGPIIILEPNATIVVEPEWEISLNKKSELILNRYKSEYKNIIEKKKSDPIMLEVFNNLFMSIADQMGVTLQKTSSSVNIKERLDFSCAIFDKEGNLIANAPHIPVHLGSMSESVKSILKQNKKTLEAGNFYMLNSPYTGGTHLPDISVIAPVFDKTGSDLLFFAGSRGHHADIGGITPGSMPSNSNNIDQEGVIIENFLLVKDNHFYEKEVIKLFEDSTYPTRNIKNNIADLKAQVAACKKGIRELQNIIDEYGIGIVAAYMNFVQDNAEKSIKNVIKKLNNCSFNYEFDNKKRICVNIDVDKKNEKINIDFSGSSPHDEGNFNTPIAVTTAAVLYVFRTLVADNIPLNSGCLKPINIIIPDDSMLNPSFPRAVVAGNVETSQNITETLIGALKLSSGSQGTMNNLTFGNKTYQYYETIAGGTGAGKGFNGTRTVQAHMTNTKITDPEILENRFPVILEYHKIRYGSGGKGKWCGGDGAIRKIKFNEKMTVSLLSSHREIAPFGLNGGKSGQKGMNWVEKENGKKIRNKSGNWVTVVEPGDSIVIQTPTGGGFGKEE
ncbi:MAG: Acetophenone carboxylase gamma subunit [Alphaproteobacteria bacterium MarineAlpha2_Bin1]|nr:MAG: Acetophenone carboxylase gamma subunit [Alphaproteobacteria bacterium MarineAlpha2_Bin1]